MAKNADCILIFIFFQTLDLEDFVVDTELSVAEHLLRVDSALP